MIEIAGVMVGGPEETTAHIRVYPLPGRFDEDGNIRPRGVYAFANAVEAPEFFKLLTKLPLKGKTLLDIGAGTGILSLIAASKGAKVIAFEEVTWIHDYLLKNVALNHFEGQIEVKGHFPSDWDGKTADYAVANLDYQEHPELAHIAKEVYINHPEQPGEVVRVPRN